MDMASILKQTGAIGAIANQLGVNEQVAELGANALLPAILGGFKNSAQAQPGGLDGLGGLLGSLGGGGLLDSVLGSQPAPVEQGNDVLGQIFGSKDVSRTVAGNAAEQTGIDSSLLKQMLPILAMAVAGYLAKQHSAEQGGSEGGLGGLLTGILGSALGGGAQAAPAAAPAAGGLGGLGSLLDMDGDGNPLNDIIGMAGKLRQ